MLIHSYEQDQQSQPSRQYVRLKSIKQMIGEEQSMACPPLGHSLTLKIKGMVLMGLLSKGRQATKVTLSRIILRWHLKSNNKRHEHAINKLMTGGKLSKQKIFYLLKIMAKKQLIVEQSNKKAISKKQSVKFQGTRQNNIQQNEQSKKQSLNQSNRQKEIVITNKQRQNNNQADKSSVTDRQNRSSQQSSPLYKKARKPRSKSKPKTSYQKRSSDEKKPQHFISNNTSLNDILIESEANLTDSLELNRPRTRKTKSKKQKQINQLSKSKQSISLIVPYSGNLQIQMATCTKLLQNAVLPASKGMQKLSGAVQICKHINRIKSKHLNAAFRSLLDNLIEEDYEDALLKVRRHLQLVQENFMVECEIEAIAQNYEQHNEHLQRIDNHIQTLKQKFMYSKTVSVVRALKKLAYPGLRIFFNNMIQQFADNNDKSERRNSIKMYEVQEFFNASSTSLSYKASSSNFFNFAQNSNQMGSNNQYDNGFYSYNVNSGANENKQYRQSESGSQNQC